MSVISDRARQPIGLSWYELANNLPQPVGNLKITPPSGDVFVLRMLIQDQNSFEIQLPEELKFCRNFITICQHYQRHVIGISHPFVYLTVRHGEVRSTTDDEWHVDGFSMKYNHLPEQSYIWSDKFPTEIAVPTNVSMRGFDPLKHNLHKHLQKQLKNNGYHKHRVEAGKIYAIDPYVIHRRPPNIQGPRTFLRLTFSPLEIRDKNNTPNPLLPKHYSYDGVKDFRNKLT